MPNLNDLSIRTRLRFGFLLLTLLGVLIGAGALLEQNTLVDLVDILYSHNNGSAGRVVYRQCVKTVVGTVPECRCCPESEAKLQRGFYGVQGLGYGVQLEARLQPQLILAGKDDGPVTFIIPAGHEQNRFHPASLLK